MIKKILLGLIVSAIILGFFQFEWSINDNDNNETETYLTNENDLNLEYTIEYHHYETVVIETERAVHVTYSPHFLPSSYDVEFSDEGSYFSIPYAFESFINDGSILFENKETGETKKIISARSAANY